MYSTALVLLAYARGKAPAMGSTLADAVERRRQLPDWDGVPPALVPLFRKMLAPNPAERIRSMAEVLAFLDTLVLPEEDAAGASPVPVLAPAAPPAPETVFAPALAQKRPAAAPKPAPVPKRGRGKATWALAALPIAGGAWWLVAAPASHPPAAPPPVRQVARTVPRAAAVPRPVSAALEGPRAETPARVPAVAALPVPTATPTPTASPTARPEATPSPAALARKPAEDAEGKLVDLQKLERSHHWQSSGVGACYRYTGDWKLIGYTSKAACALTVFFNQCQVKNGLFDKTALRRNGARIEELRGRQWQALYADRRCG